VFIGTTFDGSLPARFFASVQAIIPDGYIAKNMVLLRSKSCLIAKLGGMPAT
jgi:hypothetical protein